MINSLAYVGVESPQYKEWETFGPEVLGLQFVGNGPDGAVRLRMDEAEYRIVIHPGEKNDLAYIGWSVNTPASAQEIADRVAATGTAVAVGTKQEANLRRVTGFLWFLDPAGFRHELSWGQWNVPTTFLPGRPISGFRTADQGVGHIVLLVPDLRGSDKFYREVLGFHASDTIFDGDRELLFYHVNGRHHSLAIGAGPGGATGFHHLMVQTNSLDDVGNAYDICEERGVPITATLGRHVNDRMTSFYLYSPSVFRIEYGYGGVEIDDLWVPKTYDRTNIWGHKAQHPELPPAVIR